MADRMMLNVEVDEELGAHIAASVGDFAPFETVGDYVRDLIRRDQEQAFEELKSQLRDAFTAPEGEYVEADADAFIAEMKRRRECAA